MPSQFFYLREIIGNKMVDLLKIGFKASARGGWTFLLNIIENVIKMIILQIIFKIIIEYTIMKIINSCYSGKRHQSVRLRIGCAGQAHLAGRLHLLVVN